VIIEPTSSVLILHRDQERGWLAALVWHPRLKCWLPAGGHVERNETATQCGIREALEETSLEVEPRALLGVYSRPDRDPRGQTISVVYVGRAKGTPKARDDAKEIGLFTLDAPPTPLAFDHAEILHDYLHFLRTGEFPTPWRG